MLTARLPNYTGSNPDQSDTLAVNMAESAQPLATATATEAQLAYTLCIVGSELISYATATLTSANNYSLTYLYRGLFGSTISAHSPGEQFAFLNTNSIFKYNLPAQLVGQTVYIKLQSFNIFGGGLQSLASCTAYAYTPSGIGFAHPVAQEMQVDTSLDFGAVNVSPPLVKDDFGTPFTLPIAATIDLGAFGHPVASLLEVGQAVDFGLVSGIVTTADDFGAPFTLSDSSRLISA